jgi:UDP-glucose 4-epimerase
MAVVEYRGSKRVFNIGTGQGHSLNSLIGIISRTLKYDVKCIYLPGRTYDVPSNILDAGRADRELNWRFGVSLSEGIARLLPWVENL